MRGTGEGQSADRAWGVVALAAVAALAVQIGGVDPASAQGLEPTAASLGADLVAAQEAHLWRVAGWGGASLLTGIGLLAATNRSDHPAWQGFGIQAVAWGAINLGIVAWAFASGIDAPEPGLAGTLAAEDTYGNILLVNLGLNVGYMAVGTALVVATARGLRRGDEVRGHGLGVVVQGLGLLVLDGIAYVGSRNRMEALHGLVERVDVGSMPGSVDVTLLSLGL